MLLVKSKPHPFKQALENTYFDAGTCLQEIVNSYKYPRPVALVDGVPVSDLSIVPGEDQEIIVTNAPEAEGFIIVAAVIAVLSAGYSYSEQRKAQKEQDRLDRMNEALSNVSQSQSIRGGKNKFNKYGVVPVVLGKHLVTPFYAADPLFLRIGTTTRVYMLFAVGYGPLKITDIKIGDTLLHDGVSYSGNFEDVEVEILEGRDSDPARTIYPYATDTTTVDTVVSHTAYTNSVSASLATEVKVVLLFPNGLFHFNSKGKVKRREIEVEFGYKKTTDGTWTTATKEIGASKAAQYYYTFSFDGDGAAAYDVRVKRVAEEKNGGDDYDRFHLYEVTTLQTDTDPIQLDANIATIGLSIKKTDQFVDYINQLNCIAESYVTDWDSSETLTQNPALLYRHLLQGPFNKGALPDSRIDLVGLQDWGDNRCTPRGYTCNAVIDYQSTLKKSLDDVAATGRATFGFIDDQFGVVEDIPDATPVQTFTPRNSWNFQGARNYVDVIHAVKVRYVNETVGYQRDEWIVYDTGYSEVNATAFESIDVWGVTTPANAERIGRYILASRRLRRDSYKINVDFENLVCTRGDVVNLNHDVIREGLGAGRITAISGNDVTVDEEFDAPGGPTYGLLIRKSDGTTITGTVSSVSANVVTLTAPPTGAAVGDLCAFGESGSEVLTCRVVNINPSSEYAATLTLTQAAPTIVTIEGAALPSFPDQITGSPENNLPLPPQATIINVITSIYVLNLGTVYTLKADFYVTIKQLSSNHEILRYEIQTRLLGETEWETNQIATNTEGVYSVGPVERGSTYELRARAVNASGAGPWSTTATETVDSTPDSPVPDVRGLELFEQGNDTDFTGRDAKFVWRRSAIQEWVEMGAEAVNQGAGAGSQDLFFKDYEVKIYSTGGALRRTEFVVDPQYIYTYEKNYEDAIRLGESGAARQFKISVIQRSKQNQVSALPAQLTVQNPAPSIPAIETAPGFSFFSAKYNAPSDPDWIGLRLYISETSGFTPGDSNLKLDGPDTNIMVGDLSPATTYYYQYIPYDAFGAGTSSGELSFVTGQISSADLDDTPPTVPGNLVISTGVEDAAQYVKSFVKLTWDASTDDGILSGYFVEYWDDVDATKIQTFTSVESFRITDAVPGRTYSMRVKAVDWASNESAFSATETQLADGDTTPPAAVTGTAVTAGLDKVIISYTNPSDDDFAYVSIHRGTTAGFTPGAGNLVTSFPGDAGTTQEVIDANVTNDTAYYYKTITGDISGNESTASAAVGPVTPFKLDNTSITNYFSDGAVTEGILADLAVSADKLAGSSVTATKIANLAVGTAAIADGAISTVKIGAAAVDTAQIADAAITNAKINDLDAGKITAGFVSADRIATSSITSSKISVTSLSAISSDMGSISAGTITGGTIKTSNLTQKVQMTSGSGIEGYNASGQRTFHIAPSGNGYLGLTNTISWTTAGTVTVPGTLITGELIGKTIKTASSGWRVEIDTSGLKYWNGTTTNFQLTSGGSATFAGSLSGATGTFSGSLSAATGTFSGTISASTVTGSTLQTAASGQRFVVSSSTDYASFYNSSNTEVCRIGSGSGGSGTASGLFGMTTPLYIGAWGRGTSYGVYGVVNSTSGAGVRAVQEGTTGASSGIHASNASSSSTAKGVRGVCGSGIGVDGSGGSYDFYASGAGTNYGPFTGAHDSIALNADIDNFTPGDVLVDGDLIATNGISNAIFSSELSDQNNKPAIGVFVKSIPIEDEQEEGAVSLRTLSEPEYQALQATHKIAIVNSVGEGLINVCDQNGDIEKGDLLVTCTVPGKAAKQSDDFIRSYTIARAREAVTWANESATTKQIACIYLCG